MRLRTLFLLVLIVGMGLPAGCSFSREWNAARREPVPDHDITGAWVGTWQNSNNSHHDRLKAVITRVSETEYQARFKAWWLRLLSGTFDTPLKGHWEGDEFVFEGTQKVMVWEFHQQGRASATRFDSEYSSSDYRGSFSMERPPVKE